MTSLLDMFSEGSSRGPLQEDSAKCHMIGAVWVRRQERHRQDLLGGRRVNERVRAGFGSWTVQSLDGRRLEVVSWQMGCHCLGGAQFGH